MENEQAEQQEQGNQAEEGGKTIIIRATDRAKEIIANIFQPDAGDIFTESCIEGIKSAGRRNMPIDIVVLGSEKHGRLAIISSPVVTNIIAELTTKAGEPAKGIAAAISVLDKDGDTVMIDTEDEKRSVLQFSMNSSSVLSLASALLSCMSTHVERGFRAFVQLETADEENPSPFIPEVGNITPMPSPEGECCGDDNCCDEGGTPPLTPPVPESPLSPTPSPEVVPV